MPAASRVIFSALALLLPVVPLPTHASCQICSPATPVTEDRWGALEPHSVLGDSTDYLFNFEPGCDQEFYFDIDVQGDLLVGAAGNALEVFDLGTLPAAPALIAEPCRPLLGDFKKTDQDFYFNFVRLRLDSSGTGAGNAMAAGISGAMGIALFNMDDPSIPLLLYQDEGRVDGGSGIFLTATDLEATTVDNRHYAYLNTDISQVLVYDMTAAAGLGSTCHDGSQDSATSPCPGVYRGMLDGFALGIAMDGHYLLKGLWTNGLEVWDLVDPATPSSASLIGTIDGLARGFDLWEVNGELFVATISADGQVTQVYDLPCLSAGTCPGPLQLRATVPTPGGPFEGGSGLSASDSVRVSEAAGRVYLWIGSSSVGGSGPQREYLFDVTEPANPIELTPQVSTDGYWGWYYESNDTGFHHIAPRQGIVTTVNDMTVLTRTAWALLDIHTVTVTTPDSLFTDGFESGDTSAWDFAGTE